MQPSWAVADIARVQRPPKSASPGTASDKTLMLIVIQAINSAWLRGASSSRVGDRQCFYPDIDVFPILKQLERRPDGMEIFAALQMGLLPDYLRTSCVPKAVDAA